MAWGAAVNDDHNAMLLSLAAYFGLLSLMAVGGANATIPEMHRIAVEVQRWMTDRQFVEVFALSQIAPGPNILIVTLIGFQTAGIAGAVVATLAMCGPASLLCILVSGYWDRARQAPWRIVVMKALVPVSIGLIGASAYLLAVTIDRTWQTGLLTAVTVVIGFYARFNPLWLLAGGGVLGLAGVV
jgi:chromate transporter